MTNNELGLYIKNCRNVGVALSSVFLILLYCFTQSVVVLLGWSIAYLASLAIFTYESMDD